jgi:hypothetical protein
VLTRKFTSGHRFGDAPRKKSGTLRERTTPVLARREIYPAQCSPNPKCNRAKSANLMLAIFKHEDSPTRVLHTSAKSLLRPRYRTDKLFQKSHVKGAAYMEPLYPYHQRMSGIHGLCRYLLDMMQKATDADTWWQYR